MPEVGGSQFPLWDFFECNMFLEAEAELAKWRAASQFPLWDFFECNQTSYLSPTIPTHIIGFPLNSLCGISSNATRIEIVLSKRINQWGSQFPLWDFFECNGGAYIVFHVKRVVKTSQFPLWDFFECNRA